MALSREEEHAADELIQTASRFRVGFIRSGWTTQGAESITELIVSHSLHMQAMGDDDDDDDEEGPGDFI